MVEAGNLHRLNILLTLRKYLTDFVDLTTDTLPDDDLK